MIMQWLGNVCVSPSVQLLSFLPFVMASIFTLNFLNILIGRGKSRGYRKTEEGA
jgi:hypothetical protein